jgi:hypothetical protein
LTFANASLWYEAGMKLLLTIAGVASLLILSFVALPITAQAAEQTDLPKACIDGTGTGWRSLAFNEFTNVNCSPDTWSGSNGTIYCTGTPIGVMRTARFYTNFEMVLQWRHLKPAGNSGVFLWASEEAVSSIKPEQLPPGGIEVQILDHEFTAQFEAKTGKKGDWFSTDGDVFPVGKSTMTPFPPTSPNGQRSFPSKKLSKGSPQWNHYYVRAINGEVRLWVNGGEVSGGSECQPRFGYLCLESEGSPIEFKNLRIRELP